jgi:hypothetical protein
MLGRRAEPRTAAASLPPRRARGSARPPRGGRRRGGARPPRRPAVGGGGALGREHEVALDHLDARPRPHQMAATSTSSTAAASLGRRYRGNASRGQAVTAGGVPRTYTGLGRPAHARRMHATHLDTGRVDPVAGGGCVRLCARRLCSITDGCITEHTRPHAGSPRAPRGRVRACRSRCLLPRRLPDAPPLPPEPRPSWCRRPSRASTSPPAAPRRPVATLARRA